MIMDKDLRYYFNCWNKGEIPASWGFYSPEYREKCNAYARKWRKEHPEYLPNYLEKWKRDNPDYWFIYRQKLKTEILTYYGNNKLACVNCGFSDIRALTIDHISNDGAEHRRKILKELTHKTTFIDIYKWLKDHDFPPGYQTLCMNCQFIKRFPKKYQNS